jgi:hypothetical protein
MGITITEDISLADIDEAIKHAYEMLKTDRYGNRMTWQKRQILQNSIDDLLDARLNLVKNGEAFPNVAQI